ncbi:MAG: starch-binding protein [Bacteroidaceae bacterium]|nr:starch-binding protein [Bacteroidaceae bacterium]
MKKTFLLFAMSLLSVLGAQAQMIAYSVSTRVDGEPGPPTTIDLQGNTGKDLSGLMFDAEGNVLKDPVENARGFPIGFDFRYNGQRMRYFLIGSDLEVQLSPTKYISTEVHRNKGYWFTTTGIHDVIGMSPRQGVYGLEDTQISFWLEGEMDGYRVLCIEYKNIDFQTTWSGVEDYCGSKATIQYRLYEHDGNIEMKVKGFQPVDTGTYNFFRIGILGLPNDFVQVQSWDGSIVSSRDNSITYNKDQYPVDGQVYTFVAPEPCITPTSSGSNLELISTTHQISGKFTVGNGDHYIVLATPEETLYERPANRTRYEAGDIIGNAEVIAITDQGEFSGKEGMSQGTYSVFVIAFNNMCIDGPLYSEDILFGTIAMKPDKPVSLALASADKSSLTLKAEDSGTQMLIAMSEVQGTDKWGDPEYYGAFGTPTGTYRVGDEIEGGGKVVYVGRSSETINVSGLETGKVYFFRAWSTDGLGNYSSVWQDMNAVTAAELPWEPVLLGLPSSCPPLGWTTDEINLENNFWSVEDHNDLYFYNDVRWASAEEPAECWLQTQDICLDKNSNWLSVEIGANAVLNRLPTDWAMEDGEEIAIQLTTDGNTYTDILILNKYNMPEFTDENGTVNIWKDGEFTPFRVNFPEYAGQIVKVRMLVKRHTKGQINFRNLRIDGTLYGIVGSIPGLSGDEDLIMKQDKQDKNLYKASLDVEVTEIPVDAYEYKMRTNLNWESYQLPTYGYQHWKPQTTGSYKLLFTANIATNTLSLDELHPYEVSFDNKGNWGYVYAYAYSYDGNGNLVEHSGPWPGTKVEVSGGFFNRSWIYNFTSEQEPQYIIWNNGDGDPEYGEAAEQTEERPFVDGKAYSYYPDITSIKLPGSYNNWNAPEMIPGDYPDMWVTTIAVEKDEEFKLLVNGNWIGYDDATIDDPNGWLERGTEGSIILKHSVAQKEAYHIVAYWMNPSLDVTSGWLIAIEEGNPDAINSVYANAAQKKIIHNLAGQRLEKARKGVNIMDGEKVVVK